MGHSTEPAAPAIKNAAGLVATSITSTESLGSLIDALLSGGISPGDVELRLKDVPFDAVVTVLDGARPGPGDSIEAAFYQSWIAANPTSPMLWAALFNVGTVLGRLGDSAAAIGAYNNALSLRPSLECAAINLGLLHEVAGRPGEALATWQRAMQPAASRMAFETHQGRLLENLGRFEEAEKTLRRVLLTEPMQPDVVHHWIHLRQKTCLWPVAPSDIPGLSAQELIRSSGPFGIMALSDDIDIQRNAAADWVARKTTAGLRRLAPAKPYGHQRIRLGYISSDFCSHAMSYLITELFERHDRNRFEIFGYCSSEDDGSAVRHRVLAAFDHHRLIRSLSDEQAAQTIRDDEIDILIDLNGITDGSRIPVLRWRPAPIQATYLGFVGPVPLPELDYLLCDDVVIPPEYQAAYLPKPLSIAKIYQANDSKRSIGRDVSRAELGLPKDRFVLCCFSKHYKITEEMFAAWMTIMRQADRTVLWLAMDNPYSQANLLAAAARAGIPANRIIFSERADPDLYMSRLRKADLFLDTFPYNAGTVASDAIRMGLPLVTLCGRSFASRMATSLLHAVGATQGITTSLAKYIETVIHLATSPTDYARFKALFTPQAWNQTIGDIGAFTRQFEDRWIEIMAAASNTAELPAPEEHAITAAAAITHTDRTLKLLHVGCGVAGPEKLPSIFRGPEWREIRLDIDPEVAPDFIATLTDMQVIADDSVDAVYSSHNIEHLYPHEVALALREVRRVLKPSGFALIALPDMQEVARHIAEGKLEDPLYTSPMGPIAALDILYGHRASLQNGNLFMAHRTGFTAATLGSALINAGFAGAIVQRNIGAFALTAIAFRDFPSAEAIMVAQARMLSQTDPAAVLYKPAEATEFTRNAPQPLHQQQLAAAFALHQSGQAIEAEKLYQEIMAAPRAPAGASFGFALLCTEHGRLQEAADAYCRVIAIQPDFVDAYVNLAALILSVGQSVEAESLLRRAIALDPRNAMAHGNLGKALHDLGRFDEAVVMYQAAIALRPDNAVVHINYGAALLEIQDWHGSIETTRQALALQPGSAMAHANLGTALLHVGRHDEALAACRQAMALQPQEAAILASLGGAMLELGEASDAIALCQNALARNPAMVSAHFNLSHAFKSINQLDAAASAVREAIALCPESAEFHFHLAHILLLQGALEPGLDEYEWRWKMLDFRPLDHLRQSFLKPQWQGEDITGKTILVHTEQGLGDIIQFARYLPLLARRAKQVIVATLPPTQRLLQHIEGISVVSILESPLPAFDVYCALLSLPKAFATCLDTIPAEVPYLMADPDMKLRYDRRFSKSRLRVGIVWAGNPATQRDRFRSPGLASVMPLFSIPGIEFVVLQVGPGRQDIADHPLPPHVLDVGAELGDLTDTAAIISSLDLVISSCTAPLHLAGALAVPCWAMIPFAPHFPWLLARTDTLWYPNTKLYRQEQPGKDWTGVIHRIAGDLAELSTSKMSRRSRPKASRTMPIVEPADAMA